MSSASSDAKAEHNFHKSAILEKSCGKKLFCFVVRLAPRFLPQDTIQITFTEQLHLFPFISVV